MVAVAPQSLVQGADRAPLPYGLFSTFAVRPQGADRWESGVQFETLTCGPTGGIGAYDCDGTRESPGTIGLPKTLDTGNGEVGEGSQFTVYGHWSCNPLGFTPEQAQARADLHLLTREEARVEQALWTGDLGNTPALQDAATTSLGGGAATDLVTGVGLLEEFIASEYGSLGVIHVTRGTALALLAEGLVTRSGSRLVTELGTPVAAGAGYPGTGPTGQAVDADSLERWAFVSPAIFGYRSEIFTSSARPGDLLDRGLNTMTAVAERTYLLGFDPCGVAAALIDPAL